MKKIKYILLVFLFFISLLITNTQTLLAVDNKSPNIAMQNNFQDKKGVEVENEKNYIMQNTSNEALPTCLENGGFEQPDIRAVTGNPNCKNTQVNGDLVPNWHTTAYGNKIELFRGNNTIYIPGMILNPREGEQAAELNADENSSLYQYIGTEAGKTYDWGLSHRGRSGIDTMALIIGPKQDVDPSKPAKSGKDQFMKMGDWIKEQVDVDIGLDIVKREVGCSKKIILYSKPFAARGAFTGGDNDAFSWGKDAVHKVEWNVWIISSDKSKWDDYGFASANPDYDFTYNVPESCPESVFAFSAIQTANNNTTVGNLIDNINFKEYFNVEVYTTPGGTGTYIYNDVNDIDYYHNYTGIVLKDDDFTVMAHEKTGIDFRRFIGAHINDQFVDAANFGADGTGNYTYSVIGVDKHYKIRLIFSARYVTYDINVGKHYVNYDDYHYDGTNNTNYEVPLDPVNRPLYTSHPTKKHNADGSINDGWRFIGWKYNSANHNITFDGIHTVRYVAGSAQEEDTLSIKGNIAEGTGEAEITGISAERGATLIAEWKYRQGFIPQVWDAINRSFENNGEGGTIILDKSPSEVYEGIGKAWFGDNNEMISATAVPNSGYIFEGWYDEDGNVLSPGRTYSYHINDSEVKTAYARFIKADNLKVTKSVTGNMGNRDKYFTVNIYLIGLEENKNYNVIYSNNGTISNPNVFRTNDYGIGVISVKLKHGGNIQFNDLSYGTSYLIVEDDYSAEGYTTTGDVQEFTELTQDTTVNIVNNKSVVVPSGVDSNNKPYLYMGFVSIIFLTIIIFIIYHRRKHKKLYEE